MTDAPRPALSRRPFLASIGVLAVGAITGMGPAPAPVIYFVSAKGDDTADGRTMQTAWASIAKVNSALQAGDSALFRCGDVFYGELNIPQNCVIGSYGSGEKPVISMIKLLNNPSGWSQHALNVWRIDLGSQETHGGYSATRDANIGYLVVDGVIRASKQGRLDALRNAWDFWCDNNTKNLYVYTHDNPTSLAGDIRAAPRGDSGAVINCDSSTISIDGIHLTGGGGHGISGNGTDVTVRNCVIDGIGGSYLPNFQNGKVRYGNGIENWIGAKRWTIENNVISQIYDGAYTCQGSAGNSSHTWEDLVFRNNSIIDCTQTFEFWSTGKNPQAGFNGILVEGNICERAGYSAFADYRPNQEVRVHLLTYDWELPADIVIQNNSFTYSYGAYSFHQVTPTGLVTRNNEILLRPGTRMEHKSSETIEQAAKWQARTGRETGSSMRVA